MLTVWKVIKMFHTWTEHLSFLLYLLGWLRCWMTKIHHHPWFCVEKYKVKNICRPKGCLRLTFWFLWKMFKTEKGILVRNPFKQDLRVHIVVVIYGLSRLSVENLSHKPIHERYGKMQLRRDERKTWVSGIREPHFNNIIKFLLILLHSQLALFPFTVHTAKPIVIKRENFITECISLCKARS